MCFILRANNRIIAVLELQLLPDCVLYLEASRGAVAPPTEVKLKSL